MSKGLWACALSIFLVLGSGSSSTQAEIVDRIVATVNGDIITLKEVNKIFKPILKAKNIEDQDQANRVRRGVLEHMIERKLIEQEAERLGIIVREAMVDKAIERVKSQRNLTQEQLAAEIIKHGLDLKSFKEEMRYDLARSEVIQREVLERIVVPAKEIDVYFKDHEHEFNLGPKIRLKNILIALPEKASQAQAQEKLDLAEKVRGEIEGGLDFARAAFLYSEAANAKEGGDLGKIRWDDLDPKIRAGLEGLEAGQVSRPVRMNGGFQIFLLVERIAMDKGEEAGIRRKIRGLLAQRQMKGKVEEWLRGLRERAIIKVNF